MNEDLSSILEKLNINKESISPEMINNLMNMLNSTDTASDNANTNNNILKNNDIDINTLLKIKSILDKLNSRKNDSRSNLLESLRPFIDENKRNKLDQYIQISKIIDILPIIGGEFDGNK